MVRQLIKPVFRAFRVNDKKRPFGIPKGLRKVFLWCPLLTPDAFVYLLKEHSKFIYSKVLLIKITI